MGAGCRFIGLRSSKCLRQWPHQRTCGIPDDDYNMMMLRRPNAKCISTCVVLFANHFKHLRTRLEIGKRLKKLDLLDTLEIAEKLQPNSTEQWWPEAGSQKLDSVFFVSNGRQES